MVGEKERVREVGDEFYTPRAIDGALSHWQEILERASEGPPMGAMSQTGVPGGQDPAFADSFFALHLKADIERAWAQFPRWSAEFTTIEYRMLGYPLGVIARERRQRYEDVSHVYWRAVKEMARFLGWQESEFPLGSVTAQRL